MSNTFFQFTEGTQVVEQVYFTLGQSGENLLRRPSCEWNWLYNEVYVNIKLSHMYINNKSICEESKIYVDIFALAQFEIQNVINEESLSCLRDKVLSESQSLIYEINLDVIKDKETLINSKYSIGAPNFPKAVSQYYHSNSSDKVVRSNYNLGLYAKLMSPRNVIETKAVQSRVHLAFPLVINPSDEKGDTQKLALKRFSKSYGGYNLMGWAWIDTLRISRNEYSKGFKVDISNSEARAHMILDTQSEGEGAPLINESGEEVSYGELFWNTDLYNQNPESERHYKNVTSNLSLSDIVYNSNIGLPNIVFNRHMQNSNSLGGDGFPFDEPISNVIKVIVADTPFGGLYIGNQTGQVGLTSQTDDLINNCVGKDSRNFMTGYFMPTSLPELNVISFPNETYIKGDHRVFVNKNSVSHWLNSIEQNVEDHDQVSASDYFEKGNYPFGAAGLSTTQAFFHNFIPQILDYKGIRGTQGRLTAKIIENPVPARESQNEYNTSYNGKISRSYAGEESKSMPLDTATKIYNNRCDLSQFDTITELRGDITDEFDNTVGQMGKGYPSIDRAKRFTGSMHSNVQLEESSGWVDKLGFAIQHRPILISLNLLRELTTEEKEEYTSEPLILHMYFGNSSQRNSIYNFTLNIDFSDTTKKYGLGAHLFLLYPTLLINDLSFVSSLGESFYNLHCSFGAGNTLLPLDNHNLEHAHLPHKWVRSFDIPFSATNSFTTSKLYNRGLFEGNPLLLVDDILPKEVRDATVGEANSDFNDTLLQESVNIVTHFLPTPISNISRSTFNVCKTIYKTELSEGKKLTIGNSVLTTLLHKFMNTSKLKFIGSIKAAGNTGKFTYILGRIDAIRTAFNELNSIVINECNPFLGGSEFGNSQDKFDSIYTLATNATSYYSDGVQFIIDTTSNQNVPLTILSRKMDPITIQQGFRVESIHLGPSAGLLERDNNTINDSNALTYYLGDFYEKLDKFKTLLKEMVFQNSGEISTETLMSCLYEQNQLNSFLENPFVQLNTNLSRVIIDNGIVYKAACLLDPNTTQSSSGNSDEASFTLLLFYMSTFFPRCPSCSQPLSLSWGWCPYHGRLSDIKDFADTIRKDGVVTKEEFITYLDDPDGNKRVPAITIANELRSDATDDKDRTTDIKNKRLLVHWTEFLLKK